MNLAHNSCQISVVIPVFNEEGNILPLIQKVHSACASYSYEIVIIDDGSTDGSRKEIEEAAEKLCQVKPLFFKRNFGQTAALAAGFDHAQGTIVITMDGDGQNDPSDIPKMMNEFQKGYDVVSGWRKDRQDPFFSRKFPSWIANAIISLVTGVHIHDYGCTLKVYRKRIIDTIQIAGEMHRFLPAWCAWMGGKVCEVPVQHHPRVKGHSKYGFSRIVKVLIDLMTFKFFSMYLTKPNYLFSGTGIILLFMSVLSGGLAVYDKVGPDLFPPFRIPLMLLSVFFGLVAVLLILIGLLAEISVRLYFQIRHQKPYHLADE